MNDTGVLRIVCSKGHARWNLYDIAVAETPGGFDQPIVKAIGRSEISARGSGRVDNEAGHFWTYEFTCREPECKVRVPVTTRSIIALYDHAMGGGLSAIELAEIPDTLGRLAAN